MMTEKNYSFLRSKPKRKNEQFHPRIWQIIVDISHIANNLILTVAICFFFVIIGCDCKATGKSFGWLAQMVRALRWHRKGRWFESNTTHQIFLFFAQRKIRKSECLGGALRRRTAKKVINHANAQLVLTKIQRDSSGRPVGVYFFIKGQNNDR